MKFGRFRLIVDGPFHIIRKRPMKKEFIISVELDDDLEEILYNIRWKHVDIDSIIQEELGGTCRGLD